MNSEFERFTGTWHFTREGEPENHGWYRILPDGRCVGFFSYTFNGLTRIGVHRTYLSPESPGVIRGRLRSIHEGYLMLYRFEGERFFMLPEDAAEKGETFFEWRRIADDELPDWFEERFSASLAKPWL